MGLLSTACLCSVERPRVCSTWIQITEAYPSRMHVQSISGVVKSTNKPKSTPPWTQRTPRTTCGHHHQEIYSSPALQDDAVMQGLINVDIFTHLLCCRNQLLTPIDTSCVIPSNTCCCYKAKHLLLLLSGPPKLFTTWVFCEGSQSFRLWQHENTDCTNYVNHSVGREFLPCNSNMWQAEATAAAWPRADLQLMSSCSLQEGLVTTHLLQHQDQELEHHHSKIAAEKWEKQRELIGKRVRDARNISEELRDAVSSGNWRKWKPLALRNNIAVFYNSQCVMEFKFPHCDYFKAGFCGYENTHDSKRLKVSKKRGTHQAEVISVNMVALGIHIPKQDMVPITWRDGTKRKRQGTVHLTTTCAFRHYAYRCCTIHPDDYALLIGRHFLVDIDTLL